MSGAGRCAIFESVECGWGGGRCPFSGRFRVFETIETVLGKIGSCSFIEARRWVVFKMMGLGQLSVKSYRETLGGSRGVGSGLWQLCLMFTRE
jgi:hypothetical protein